MISLLYDADLGAVEPAVLKTDLAFWLAAIQAADRSVCYQPGAWCDHSNTGGWLLAKKLVGAQNPGVSCSTVVVPKIQSNVDRVAAEAAATAAKAYCAANNGTPPPGFVCDRRWRNHRLQAVTTLASGTDPSGRAT